MHMYLKSKTEPFSKEEKSQTFHRRRELKKQHKYERHEKRQNEK